MNKQKIVFQFEENKKKLIESAKVNSDRYENSELPLLVEHDDSSSRIFVNREKCTRMMLLNELMMAVFYYYGESTEKELFEEIERYTSYWKYSVDHYGIK